jgi:hypothetical protein
MNQKLSKKIRKSLKRSAQENAEAFRKVIRGQSFIKRLGLAWRILINRV